VRPPPPAREFRSPLPPARSPDPAAAAVLGFPFGGPLDRPPGVSLFQLPLIVLVSELIVSRVVFCRPDDTPWDGGEAPRSDL
jgi:hypothetical protein